MQITFLRAARQNRAFWLTLIYALLGITWISTSDLLVPSWLNLGPEDMPNFQLIKGIFYVLATAFLFYFLALGLFRQIIQRQEELELILATPLFGIIRLNHNLAIQDLSATLRQRLNYQTNEILGVPLHSLLAEEHQGKVKEFKKLAPGESLQWEAQFKSKKQEGSYFRLNIAKRKKNKKAVYTILAEDITERKLLLERTQAQNQRFREISWIQSHLVRAPLARIKELNISLKMAEYENEDEEGIYRQALDQSIDELDRIIHDISEKAREIEEQEVQEKSE